MRKMRTDIVYIVDGESEILFGSYSHQTAEDFVLNQTLDNCNKIRNEMGYDEDTCEKDEMEIAFMAGNKYGGLEVIDIDLSDFEDEDDEIDGFTYNSIIEALNNSDDDN